MDRADRFDYLPRATKVFEMKWVAGSTYVVDLASPHFDTYLVLEDAAGKRLAQNDDFGGTLNSRLVFTAPATGTYRVIASALGDRGQGSFVLQVRPAQAEETKNRPPN